MWKQNSSGYFWTESCSSGHFPAQAQLQQEGCFCTNKRQICPTGEKANSFIYWKVPFPNENICSASHILELFQAVLDFFPPFLIWYRSFFRQLLKDYHAKGYSTHPPFTMPWILHVPVLNTPGFNLKLNIGSTKACAVKQMWQSSLWQTKLA